MRISVILVGLLIVLIAGAVYAARPNQTCSWWDLVCQGSTAITSPIYFAISMVLFALGIIMMISGMIIKSGSKGGGSF